MIIAWAFKAVGVVVVSSLNCVSVANTGFYDTE